MIWDEKYGEVGRILRSSTGILTDSMEIWMLWRNMSQKKGLPLGRWLVRYQQQGNQMKIYAVYHSTDETAGAS